MVPIFVEENHLLDESNSHPHIPEREAPYYVYDCLKPVKNTVAVGENGVSAIYFSEKIPSLRAALSIVTPILYAISHPGIHISFIRVKTSLGCQCALKHIEQVLKNTSF